MMIPGDIRYQLDPRCRRQARACQLSEKDASAAFHRLGYLCWFSLASYFVSVLSDGVFLHLPSRIWLADATRDWGFDLGLALNQRLPRAFCNLRQCYELNESLIVVIRNPQALRCRQCLAGHGTVSSNELR
jgi:hypothetical protein